MKKKKEENISILIIIFNKIKRIRVAFFVLLFCEIFFIFMFYCTTPYYVFTIFTLSELLLPVIFGIVIFILFKLTLDFNVTGKNFLVIIGMAKIFIGLWFLLIFSLTVYVKINASDLPIEAALKNENLSIASITFELLTNIVVFFEGIVLVTGLNTKKIKDLYSFSLSYFVEEIIYAKDYRKLL